MSSPLSCDRALLAETIAVSRQGRLPETAAWQNLLTRIARRLEEPDPVEVLQQTTMVLMAHIVWAQQDTRSPEAAHALRAALIKTEQMLSLTGAFEPESVKKTEPAP